MESGHCILVPDQWDVRDLFLTKTAEIRLEASTTMPLGLWADGCPVKWDRSESIVVISLNFPGQTLDKYKRLRIPLCVPGLFN